MVSFKKRTEQIGVGVGFMSGAPVSNLDKVILSLHLFLVSFFSLSRIMLEDYVSICYDRLLPNYYLFLTADHLPTSSDTK